MKNLQHIILLALFSTLFLASCDESGLSTQPAESQEREISATEMAHQENPYDKQGAIHNEFLDYFITHRDTSEVINPEKMLAIYKGFYASKNMEFGDKQIAGYRELFHTYGEIASIGGPYTEFLCEEFPFICDILTPSPTIPLPVGLLDEDNGGTSTERTLQFIKAVKTNENKISSDKDLTEEQKKVLLTQHAVARYSAGYWHNVWAIQKDESGYYGPFQEIEAAQVCGTCDVVGADAAGAAVGALVGGVGAGPGAAVASAAAVIEKWFW